MSEVGVEEYLCMLGQRLRSEYPPMYSSTILVSDSQVARASSLVHADFVIKLKRWVQYILATTLRSHDSNVAAPSNLESSIASFGRGDCCVGSEHAGEAKNLSGVLYLPWAFGTRDQRDLLFLNLAASFSRHMTFAQTTEKALAEHRGDSRWFSTISSIAQIATSNRLT